MSKRERSANFTKEEIDLLVDICLKYKNILENKRTNSTSWKIKKDTWMKVTEEFNASTGNWPRNVNAIKSKYETIKKDIRKKCATVRNEQKKTGGGSNEASELKAYEEKILAVSQVSMLGVKPRFDNDTITEPEEFIDEDVEDMNLQDNDPVREYLTEMVNSPIHENVHGNMYDSPHERNNEEVDLNLFRDTEEIVSAEKGRGWTSQQTLQQRPGVKKLNKKKTNNTNLISLKETVLEQQLLLIQQEMKQKAELHELQLTNLKLDMKIKETTLQKLRFDMREEWLAEEN